MGCKGDHLRLPINRLIEVFVHRYHHSTSQYRVGKEVAQELVNMLSSTLLIEWQKVSIKLPTIFPWPISITFMTVKTLNAHHSLRNRSKKRPIMPKQQPIN